MWDWVKKFLAEENESLAESKRLHTLKMNIQSRVINRLNLDARDFTDMLNYNLREKYNKPKMETWLDMNEEECRKVLAQYGNMRT